MAAAGKAPDSASTAMVARPAREQVLPALTRPPAPRAPWISSAVLFLLVAALTFLVLYARGIRSGNGIVVPRLVRTIFPAAGLGLRVEGQGDRLLLSWNKRSPTVLAAREGVLAIEDGGRERQVHLSSDQLADGSVLYRPASDDVLFRLETRGYHGSAAESIRVLDGGKPAHAGFGGSTPEPTPANVKSTEAKQPAPLPPYVPARPDRQVLPDLTETGSEMEDAPPEVDVQVRVDADGHVRDAHVVTGGVSSFLARAVTAAAEKWTFLPATRGGKAIASEHTIIFQFQSDSH